MTATAIPTKRTVNAHVTWDGTDEVRDLTWVVKTRDDAQARRDGIAHAHAWAHRQGCEGFTILSVEVEPPAYIVRFLSGEGAAIPMALPVGTSRHDAETVALRLAANQGTETTLWAAQPHPSGSGIVDTPTPRKLATITANIEAV